MGFIKNNLSKVNFLKKSFYTDIVPSIELPNIFIVFLLAILFIYTPFIIIVNSKTTESMEQAVFRTNTCLQKILTKTSPKCIQGQLQDTSTKQLVKFIAYELANKERRYETSFLLTKGIQNQIDELYDNAEKHQIIEMMDEEDCKEQKIEKGRPKKKCKVFKNYNVINAETEITTYIVLYNKEIIEKYINEFLEFNKNTF